MNVCSLLFASLFESNEEQVSQWDIMEVYRKLRGLDVKTFETNHPGIMHPRLRILLELTDKLCRDIQKTAVYAHQPRTTVSVGSSTQSKSISTNIFSKSGKKSIHKMASLKPPKPSKRAKLLDSQSDTQNPSPFVSQNPSPFASQNPSLFASQNLSPFVSRSSSPIGNEGYQVNFDTSTTNKKETFKEGCRKCEKLPSEEKCRRYIEVEERRSVAEYEGCLLTCTDDVTDRLPPLVIPFFLRSSSLLMNIHRKSKILPMSDILRPKNWTSSRLPTVLKLKSVAEEIAPF